MWSLCVVPDQVLHQVFVEDGRIVQAVRMPVRELLLNSAVKSLQVPVGLRMSGIVEEMHELLILARLIEVFEEFAAVVSLNVANGEGGYAGKLVQEVLPLLEELVL